MKHAEFRFYAELNDFLPAEKRFTSFDYRFLVSPAVKDAIESLGVPHTEVDLILVNGESVDFAHLLADGDRIAVYPVFEALDIGAVARVRPEPLRETRFVLDVHIGRLAAYLRMLGFDAAWGNRCSDAELARTSVSEHRILLTRDRGLLKRGEITHGYCPRSSDPREQLVEVVRRFDLVRAVAPFTRCLRCNVVLEPASPYSVKRRIPNGTLRRYTEYRTCPSCGRVYWKGSHYRRMEQLLRRVMEDNDGQSASSPRDPDLAGGADS